MENIASAYSAYRDALIALKSKDDTDESIQVAHSTTQLALDKLAGILNNTWLPARGGTVRPALLSLNEDRIVLAVGDDYLWLFDGQSHKFPPSSKDDERKCLNCDMTI